MCISSRSDFYRIRLCHAVELPGLSPKLLQQTKPPSKLSKPWNNSWFEAAWALHQRYHAEGSLSSTARVSPWQATRFKIEQSRRCRSTAGGAWAAWVCRLEDSRFTRVFAMHAGERSPSPGRAVSILSSNCATQSTNVCAKERFPSCGSSRSQ